MKLFFLALCLTFVTVSSHAAPAVHPFHQYLNKKRRNQYTEDEERAYAKTHVQEYVDAIFLDTKKISENIIKTFDPQKYFYIDIGAGPAPVASYLANRSGVSRANLPLSGFMDYTDDRGFFVYNSVAGQPNILPVEKYQEILRDHFARFIPQTALTSDKTILLIDTVESGTTLFNVHRRVSDYIHSFNPKIKVEALGLLHAGAKAVSSRPTRYYGPETDKQIAARLRNFDFIPLGNTLLSSMIFSRNFQEFSEYTRFEPGRELSTDVKSNATFEQMAARMRESMLANGVPVNSAFTCSELFKILP